MTTWPLTAAVAVSAAAMVMSSCSSSSSNVVKPPASAPATSSTPSSGSASSASSSSQHGAPSVTITPSTGLAATQAVQVVGTGFTPGEQLQVIECGDKGKSTGPGDCDLAASQAAASDSTGAVRVTLTVSRGPFGANKIVCGGTQKCLVSVTQASLQPTEEADAPISFTG
jgi:hypothetical protein